MPSDSENTIQLKRTTTSNRMPPLSALALGELALNVVDGKIFFKKINNQIESVISFLNSEYDPFTFNKSLSSYSFKHQNNTVSEIFSSILNGIEHKVSGAASSIINGENNEIQSNFSVIGSGYNNKILLNANNSFNAAGSANLIRHQNVFTLGSNLSSHAQNFTYVNNLSSTGSVNVQEDLEIKNFNKGVILVSPNNSRWRITVNNSGQLITTLI